LKPLIYLELRQFVNSVRNTVRSPRRLIPSLITGAWVVAWFVQSLLLMTGAGTGLGRLETVATVDVPTATIRQIVFVMLSIGSVAVMYSALSSGLMVFSIAQIDFLFPTPISRRKVLLVKLFRDYLKYLFWVAFFFLLIGSPLLGSLGISVFPWGLVSIGAILALLLFVVNISHTINIVFAFSFERLKQADLIFRAALILVAASAIGYGVYRYLTTGDWVGGVLFAVDSPVVNAVFAPAGWCADLFVAPLRGVIAEEWIRFALLWILAVGSTVLLLSRRENVYEPSLGVSLSYARRRQAAGGRSYTEARLEALREKGARSAGGPAIPPFGQGATAFLWKNLLLRYRLHWRQLALMAVLPLLIVYSVRRFATDDSVAQNIPYAMAYIVWILAMAAQAEMRADLKHSNTVKAMPISAWKLVLAQVLSSVVYLSAGIGLFSFLLWLLVPASRGPALIATALATPFVGFANVSAAFIPGLLYPDARDVAQNYICGMVGFLLASVAILPTVVLGVTLIVVLRASPMVALIPVAIANLLVGVAGVSIAGAIFRRFDPTSE
jgi:hypothetical protein